MTKRANRRAGVYLRKYFWRLEGEPDIAGVGLFQGERMICHLTPAEARATADRLHDLADALDSGPQSSRQPPAALT